MARITAIKKSVTIDNRQKPLFYLAREDRLPYVDRVSEVLSVVEKAASIITIASTAELDPVLHELLVGKTDQRVRVYGLVQDFSKSVQLLSWFDARKPALFRENKALCNNFILVDRSVGFLFVNSMETLKDNPCIRLEGAGLEDLFYWFTYYFWHTEGKERMLDRIESAREAPYPVPRVDRPAIQLLEEASKTFEQVYLPMEPFCKSLVDDRQAQECLVSEMIKTPLLHSFGTLRIGHLELADTQPPGINAQWRLSYGALENVPQSFIDFDDKQWTPRERSLREIRLLPDLNADSIRDMEQMEPDEYLLKPLDYALETIFHWRINPPRKPASAKLATVYDEYKRLADNLKENLRRLSTGVSSLIEGPNGAKLQPGMRQELIEIQEKQAVLELSCRELEQRSFSEIKDLVERDWPKLAERLRTVRGLLKPSMENNSELENLRKRDGSREEYRAMVLPRYRLPEIGRLFETDQASFLEIADYEDLEKAEGISDRYRTNQKPCKIVAEAVNES